MCHARDAPARHGTGDLQIYGTARHGKSWHGKILARHGTEHLGTEKYWHDMARKSVIKLFFGEHIWVENPRLFHKIQISSSSHSHKIFDIYGKIDLEKLITTNPI